MQDRGRSTSANVYGVLDATQLRAGNRAQLPTTEPGLSGEGPLPEEAGSLGSV